MLRSKFFMLRSIFIALRQRERYRTAQKSLELRRL